jgi:hypothetical protein
MSADVSNYLGLVTSKHSDKPNFLATVAISVQGYADTQAVLNSLPAAYDVDEAVGAQLDAVGLRVGASRELQVPLEGVYFSFGIAGLGWGQGAWKGPFDPSTGLVSLDDATFRILIKAVIAANQWDGTIPGAYMVYADLFTALGAQILIFDHQDMTMTIGYVGPAPNAVVKALLVGGYLSLKPATVGITGYVTPSVPGAPFFGFGADNATIGGFGSGAWATPV